MNCKQSFESYLTNLNTKVQNAYETAVKLREPGQYGDLKHDLTNALKNLKGFQAVHFYGSRMSGLASKDSDMDVFVQMNDDYHKQKLSELELARAVEGTVEIYKNSPKFEVLETFPDACVPICIILYKPTSTRLQMDHSYKNGLGVENNKIINHWMSFHNDEVRKFNLFMRGWFDMSPMKEYHFHKTLDLLAIFYLQKTGFLPSFDKMKKKANQPIKVDGCDVAFNDKLKAADYGLKAMASYKQHISGFFKFYATLDFSKYFICPYAGELIERKDMFTADILAHQKQNLETIDAKKPMIVFGFLNLARNFAADIDDELLKTFQKFCQDSADLVEKQGI